MPAFQNLVPVGGQKRKSDFEGSSSKRVAVNPEASACEQGSTTSRGTSDPSERYWMVQWRIPQYKKHKTWDGDAILVENGIKGTLYDLQGKPMGMGNLGLPICEGNEYSMSGKEFEVDCPISRDDFISGSCFGLSVPSTLQHRPVPSASRLSKQFVPLQQNANSGYLANAATKNDRKVMPLQPVNLVSHSDGKQPQKSAIKTKIENSYWTACWRKLRHSKQKGWEGDAFVSHVGDTLTMVSEDGKIIASTTWKGDALCCGYQIFIAGKEVELDNKISATQFPAIVGSAKDTGAYTNPSPKPTSPLVLAASASPTKPFVAPTCMAPIAPASFYGASTKSKTYKPLHDPDAEGAVVMMMPNKKYMAKHNKKGLPLLPVVLDPILARRMRPHQKEGVKFLYECVMGLRKHDGQGCILADEMGLGKTLQTISLVWTLLKQNPIAGIGPVIGKALIVCPVSLVNNWKNEFHKWLGKDRVGVLVGDKNKAKIKSFTYTRTQQVLVIGYERLRTIIDELAYCEPPIGLIICDEGHRLKSTSNKTSAMFKALRTPRRIILSGTPIQNDLGELHAMTTFCNPGLFDDYATFRQLYEMPIMKSRAPDCSSKEAELGEKRHQELLATTKSFVLRRDATILKNYLPPKHEYVVFVTPTTLQLDIFSRVLNPERLDDLMQNSIAESLALINLLTKICNSPILLKATADKAKKDGDESSKTISRIGVKDALTLLPDRVQPEDMSISGKLTALANLLRIIRETTEEKCIIVSHFTSTLNIIEAYCKKKSYTYYRLDGQTPAAKRQEYVNQFNKTSQRSGFLFLLSSKAGGVGLSLIGASRLCLIDGDWNPSHDLQSMARIHRDGQKRPVFIYRFLTSGTIDEKIFQRQVTKLGLSESFMGSGVTDTKTDSFTRKDLRDIFRVHLDTACNTHDLLECSCDKVAIEDDCQDNAPIVMDDDDDDDDDDGELELEKGFVVASQVKPEQMNKIDQALAKKKKSQLAALGEWTHINCLAHMARDCIKDDILRQLIYSPPERTEKQPKSRIDSLLDAVDLDNLPAAPEDDTSMLTVRNVPGGSISFLFERSSTVLLEPSEVVS